MDLSHVAQSICAFFIGLFIWIISTRQYNVPSGFATKTVYNNCALQSFSDDCVEHLKSQCQLVHINALFRHGTRSSSGKDIRKFVDLYNRLIESETAKLPPGFIDHPIPFEHHAHKVLLPTGFRELYELGQKFRQRASSAFDFHDSNIRFVSSSYERALDSGRSFYHGFFNLPPLHNSSEQERSCPPATDSQSTCITPIPGERILVDDSLLRFFDYCERYRRDIEKNRSSIQEYLEYRHGPEMLHVLHDVVKKFNLDKKRFTVDDMYTLYVACAFETANDPESKPRSPWCAFFETNHFPVLEYQVDLKQFWLKSYGYELNYLQSCPLVGSILAQLRDFAINYKQKSPTSIEHHRATFWFGHAETLLPVVAAFGLFNDSVGHDRLVKLRANGFLKWLAKLHSDPVPPTMFRSGHIAPFAGNLALFLYYCPNAALESDSNDPFAGFYVQPEVNERTVAWPLGAEFDPPTTAKPGATCAPLSRVLRRLNNCMPDVYDESKVCQLNVLAHGA